VFLVDLNPELMKKWKYLLLLSLIGCQVSSPDPGPPPNEPIAEGQHFKAGFLIVDGVYNSELVAPYDIFHHTIFHTEGGIEVFTVAESMDTITTFEGLKLLPHFDFETAPDMDILVVPSAEHSMSTDLENAELIQFVKKTGSNAKFVMSLCDGAFVLAKAGLVDGHQSTTFPSDIPKYKETYPHLQVHENVSFVHDNNLITSSGGAKSYDPALYLVHLLYGEKVAIGVGKGLVIDWNLSQYQYIKVD
jgi:transcriptional regulator GlxA family with amidase domain